MWLSGKPRRVLSLHWPENDPIILRESANSYEPSGTWSVLDDQVLRAFSVRDPNERYSAIYLAKIHEAIARKETTTAFVKIATLPHIVHRVALLPDSIGFASLEYIRDASTVTLRIHDWDGTALREKTTHAATAYSDLVVNRNMVAVCVSSGQPPSRDMYLEGSPDRYHRVDADRASMSDLLELRNLIGDQIVVWRIDTDTLTTIQIPQDENAPLTHEANFQFVRDSHIALGGKVQPCFGRPSALLKSFCVNNPAEFSRTFSHGDNFEMDDDRGIIAKPGSSGDSAVLANYHHAGSRLTVVDNGVLSGEIDSEPSSEDPEGLHHFWDHPRFTRTIKGTINEFLPSISDNRLLVALHIESDDEGFKKFAIPETHKFYSAVLFLYDFDQARCKELCDLTTSERTTLESKLREENANAYVSVVERNFYPSIEDERDTEWPPESAVPDEWRAHLRKLYETEESRRTGQSELPVLEFDEAPDMKKGTPRMLFTRSAVWFPEKGLEYNRLALTTSGIIHVPPVGGVGHIFCFGDL